ncbi:hypothetical protein [Halomicrobium mukohataei]|uniref:Uncharacterized protein n=1 Tax=Halomicrobium mukohataei (strain ATCC 700874 / DSM 12286 / JCM 9738 / NCIMB 13541) TaxID=485914 RepID=C7P001_HALMD|nr:hypothetical protein [Halomicrobium mukohataei]ACV46909.1 hypothetical protein Hmuk_0778 [Halomicrobium mukohataei DSM 12286]
MDRTIGVALLIELFGGFLFLASDGDLSSVWFAILFFGLVAGLSGAVSARLRRLEADRR